ncbi:hypothetical protein HN018_18370 [Lichenicola cladoniae]|uniref:Uncharacterized protein n=1 Tax=Lichenicola cladoniae TaxID=1484109 RepID=A0A6M8HU45_9PROT|nr:hypothetical protein [Lichenicola cladoniae]NPD67623.1 hypothetical protein [Acetobacteraceae bacterium]QKE91735.1 hypothetical protein HN018_18370 [Lichenicola cladoniae]
MSDEQQYDDDDGPTASLIETTALELSDKADWRRKKAQQYPDDERNLDAAELLDRLAGEVLALEGLPAAGTFETEYEAIFADDDDHRPREIMRLWAEYRAGIGFRIFPDTGEGILRDLIELARSAP